MSILDLLTPGSVWKKLNGKKAGATASVLFLTNENIKAVLHDKYPPQVVYSDENGHIYSRTFDSFFENYQFYNVNPELEVRLSNLFVFDEDSFVEDEAEPQEQDAEDEVSDTLPVTASETTKSFADQFLDSESESSEDIMAEALAAELNDEEDDQDFNALALGFEFYQDAVSGAAPLTGDQLSAAVVGFSQEPNRSYDMTQHKLLFALSDTITLDALKQTFEPNEHINTVDRIQVRTSLNSEIITWNAFIGVFPEYNVMGLYGVVMLGTDDQQPEQDVVTDVESTDVPEQAEDVSATNVETIPAVEPEVQPVAPQVQPVVQPQVVTQPNVQVVNQTPLQNGEQGQQ